MLLQVQEVCCGSAMASRRSYVAVSQELPFLAGQMIWPQTQRHTSDARAAMLSGTSAQRGQYCQTCQGHLARHNCRAVTKTFES